jgi:NAD(P)-dependent dehydrogenase (short-subunit alcohol dehydrogenase family)
MNFTRRALVRLRRRAAANGWSEKLKSIERNGPGWLPSAPLGPSTVEETAVAADFAGKTALITGAGRGIGRAIAVGLAGAGARVILLARTAAQLDETRAVLRERGVPAGRISLAPADLSDEKDRSRAAAAVLAAGRVDILVNNANVSSGIAANPAGMVRGNAYATTKAAIEAHTVNLAAELNGTGVTVNAYRPGGVDTAMQAWIHGQDPARIGAALHTRFNQNFTEGTLITPEQSAAVLIAHLDGDDSGSVWDVSDATARV